MSIIRSFVASPRRYEQSWETNGASITSQISLSFQDYVPAAAATANFDIGNIPGGFIIEDAWAQLRTNFTGGSIGSATFSVGTTGSPTLYILATTVFAGSPVFVGVTNAQKGTAFTSPQTVFVNNALPPAVGTIRTQLIVSTNSNQLVAGKIDLFLQMRAVNAKAN
jgi:hypothetical protein